MHDDYSPENPPPADLVDRWLAGDLDGEAAEGIERYFEEHPPGGATVEAAAELGEKLWGEGPEMAGLIEKIVAGHKGVSPANDPEMWREVVEAPGDGVGDGTIGILGSYEVLEVIASGGMGIVLKARDPELGRLVALKVLSPSMATNATARERFLREAQAAAKMEHENILPIYGVHAEAVPYFAMRYVAGGTLQDAIDGGREFTSEELAGIAAKAASALGTAHAAGIVHRDIKPANILLGKDGEKLWVCDFGIARSAGDPSLTYAGMIAGTPHYMSPEQAAGHLVDGRSDLFSLGSVLYHCSTGKRPFRGETSMAVLKEVVAAAPKPPTKQNPELAPWLGYVIERLLAKEPEDRFKDAAELSEALELRAKPPRRWLSRRAKTVLSAAAVFLVLLTGLVFVANRAGWLRQATGGGVVPPGGKGPDAFGYTWTDTYDLGGPRYHHLGRFRDGEKIIEGDAVVATVELDPPFEFYGESLSAIRVSKYAYLAADLSDPGTDNTPDCPLPAVPSDGPDGPRIYVYSGDFSFGYDEEKDEHGWVSYKRLEDVKHPTLPGGAHVFTWNKVIPPGETAEFFTQAVLFDSGDILVQPQSQNPTGTGNFSAAAGIQKSGTTTGLSTPCGVTAPYSYVFATQFRPPIKSAPPVAKGGRTFLMNGTPMDFADLAAAIAFAPPGASIGLPDGLPHIIEDIEIPAGKPLILAAGTEDTRPLLQLAPGSQNGITTRSQFRIGAIDLEAGDLAPGASMFRAIGAPIIFRNGVFTTSLAAGDLAADLALVPAFVEVSEGASVDFRRSRTDLPGAALVRITRGSNDAPADQDVFLRESEFSASILVAQVDPVPAGGWLRVALDHAQCTAQHVLSTRGEAVSPLYLWSESCTFTLDGSFVSAPAETLPSLEKHLAWHAANLTIEAGSAVIRAGEARRPLAPFSQDLSELPWPHIRQ